MAYPDDPHFAQAELHRLNLAFRGLGLGYQARVDVAHYIGNVTERDVDTWQATRRGPTFARRWEDDYSRREMMSILRKRSVLKKELRRAAALRGIEFYAKATKEQMIYDLTHAKTKSELGQILDFLRPRPIQQTDALPDDPYLNQNLSSFARGTPERRRADVILALLSEVKQTPECTGGEDFEMYPIRFGSADSLANPIDDAEESLIWPLRQGTATAPPLLSNAAYVNEAWNTVQLWKERGGWAVTIWLYTAVSEDSNGNYQTGATGWPTRDNWGEFRRKREAAKKAEKAKGKGKRK